MLIRCLTTLLLLALAHGAQAEQRYGFKVLEQVPQSRDYFVQGLHIEDGQLYLGTGGYRESRLLRFDLASGELLDQKRLSPRHFGEGVTVLGDEVFQLTWRARMLLVYERDDFKAKRWHRLPGEGWGLTHDDSELIYSDGSDQLYFLDPATGEQNRSIGVTRGGAPLRWLNELEYIDGKVWANVWQSDEIVMIDPASGEVTASIDLTGLLPGEARTPTTDVLNGIAYNLADDALWVTGKRWPYRYRIELVPKP